MPSGARLENFGDFYWYLIKIHQFQCIFIFYKTGNCSPPYQNCGEIITPPMEMLGKLWPPPKKMGPPPASNY